MGDGRASSRVLRNQFRVHADDILPKIRKPVLITHGALDAIVKPIAVDQHKAVMPHAQIQLMPNTAHAAFWDDAPTFNKRHTRFAKDFKVIAQTLTTYWRQS